MNQPVEQAILDGVLYRASDSAEHKEAMDILYKAVCDKYGISSELSHDIEKSDSAPKKKQSL